MNSPTAALTWEIWCRHRKRLLTVLFLILGFALFYSKLCASIGLHLDSPNILDSITENALPMRGTRPEILQLIAWMVLTCAPLGCMVMTLLYVVWVFTFTDLNPREPFSFPKRFFTLPISTRYLASRLMASGAAATFLAYLGWTRLVHLPHIDVFDGFNDGLAWITLLILSQAIVWSLDAFPFTRVLLLIAAAFFLLAHPDFQWYRSLEAHQTPVQLSLLFIGCGMAYVGLDKIRHGCWQRWLWKWRLPSIIARTELSGPKSFRSATQAQFWFEWRRHGRKLFYCVCALSGVPVLMMVPEFILHPGSQSADSTRLLTVYLLAVPIFIHFCQGVSHERSMPQFTAMRPINNGEIAVAQWKAVALSAVLSWAVTFLLVGVVAMLGDLDGSKDFLHSLPQYQHIVRPLMPVILLGMIFCTWGFVADRVWVGATMGTWIHRVYASIVIAMTCVGAAWLFAVTHRSAAFREILFRVLPELIVALVVLKFFLAQWAFRTALKKQLLARSTLIKYLFIWTALAVVFLVPTFIVCRQESGIIPLCLGIVLMLPLARIGFAPLALNLGRHH